MYGTEAIAAYKNLQMPKEEIKKPSSKKFGLLSRDEVEEPRKTKLSPEETVSSLVNKLRKARQGLE